MLSSLLVKIAPALVGASWRKLLLWALPYIFAAAVGGYGGYVSGRFVGYWDGFKGGSAAMKAEVQKVELEKKAALMARDAALTKSLEADRAKDAAEKALADKLADEARKENAQPKKSGAAWSKKTVDKLRSRAAPKSRGWFDADF